MDDTNPRNGILVGASLYHFAIDCKDSACGHFLEGRRARRSIFSCGRSISVLGAFYHFCDGPAPAGSAGLPDLPVSHQFDRFDKSLQF